MSAAPIEYLWELIIGSTALLFLALVIIAATIFYRRKISDENKKFELLFNRVFDALIVFDEQGKIVDTNESATRMLGYGKREFKSLGFSDLFSKCESGPGCYQIFNTAKEEFVCVGENRVVTSIGASIIVDCAAVRVEHADCQYIITSLRDISERKLAQEALKESEERHRAVWEYSPAGICLTDKDGVYRYVNPAYCNLYGYSEEELIGRPFYELIMEVRDLEVQRRRYNKLFEDGKSIEMGEAEFVKKSGEPIWVHYTGDFVRRDKKPIYMVALNIDITEQKRNRRELDEERLILQEKNAALHEVLSHIEEEKLKTKKEIAEAIDQVLIPVFQRLANDDGTLNKVYYGLLENNLRELAEFSGGTRQTFSKLTPREIEICTLIKSGATSKEISKTLDLSLLTINKHRQRIRRKLVIRNKDINLTSYLRNLDRQ